MLLRVLGCSGTVPGPDSPCSGYLVEHNGFRLVLDLGTGALGGLLASCPDGAVDAVLVSHEHGDHSADLTALAYLLDHAASVASASGAAHGGEPVTVVAPTGLVDRLRAQTSDPARLAELLRFLPAEELAAEPFTLGPFAVRLARVRHQVPTFAARVTAAGRTLAYTADTGPCTAVTELAAGAHLLLSEAALTESDAEPVEPDPAVLDRPPFHLTPAQAGDLARRAQVGALVLTHLRPWADTHAALRAARGAYPGPIVLASSGLSVAV